MTSVQVSDHWVAQPEGRLFARQWTPEAPSAAAPVLMFHDSLGCVELWRGFPEALCALTSRRVVAYDRLGFGRSDARADLPSLDFVAEEAERTLPALRAQLEIDRFVAFGHSVGGGMAIHAAARAGAACEGLITIAAQVYAEDRTLQGIAAAKEQFKEPAQVERLAKYHGPKTRWVLSAWIDNWLDPRFGAWTLKDVLPNVTCPVLSIHGKLDEYGSAVHPTLIGRLCSGTATIELLAGVGHVPHREQPDWVGERVARFLAAVGGGSAS